MPTGRLAINPAQTWTLLLFMTSQTIAIAGVVESRKSKGWWKIAMVVLAIVTALVDGINWILQPKESHRFAAIWKSCWDVVKLLWPLVKAVWARFHPAKVFDANDGYVDRVLCHGVIPYMHADCKRQKYAERKILTCNTCSRPSKSTIDRQFFPAPYDGEKAPLHCACQCDAPAALWRAEAGALAVQVRVRSTGNERNWNHIDQAHLPPRNLFRLPLSKGSSLIARWSRATASMQFRANALPPPPRLLASPTLPDLALGFRATPPCKRAAKIIDLCTSSATQRRWALQRCR
ncbi:hypothetical protein FN846DRAFT_887364 [Sphaerosporella brunnea]|uniref:Uncharacterized protein n=1 Tax=Sphaerosporella brunnea TaxID=1250544 RepID=A0A5J5F615_9PEZI|nr:hypothetical protein FN846DRAFT_887364 [Sphaerosporella brunnea]